MLVAIPSVLGIFSLHAALHPRPRRARDDAVQQRTFRDLYDPTNAITQAVISFFSASPSPVLRALGGRNQRGR
jgi:hypothetical protein